MSKIKSGRKLKKSPDNLAYTHDFTECKWGHNIVVHKVEAEGYVIKGYVIKGSLWTNRRVIVGDFILFTHYRETTRYRLIEVQHLRDPGDMSHFAAEFAPRS